MARSGWQLGLSGELRDNLFDRAQLRGAVIAYFRHPVTIACYLVTPVFKLLGYQALEFPALGMLGDNLFYILRVAAYALIAIWVVPHLMRLLMPRNVPWFIVGLLPFFVLCAVQFATFHAILLHSPEFSDEVGRIARIFVQSVLFFGFQVYVYQDWLRPMMGHDPALVPYWLPVARRPLPVARADLVAPGLTGKLVSLRAQNQYVMVTSDEGRALVRTTLKSAMEKVPPRSGRQIHRSWWLSETELHAAQRRADPTRLIGPDGTEYPVGARYIENLPASPAPAPARKQSQAGRKQRIGMPDWLNAGSRTED
ncbi:LytTR family DNA-binding domain-containing protein [uncultured Maritimibacter sp.]|jgi:hypothetical protein|uniref:LytTR family DNA-binding domain-containing protein n=1 Tax=uncultured Maritimibacter sp. TaxID=991866 RepID=UPI00261B633C|nr:LytTR family DNA-binding domain-containing protein [uncultured Maritimibacter sp.]